MTISEGDMAILELKMDERAEKLMERVMSKHLLSCPHGKALLRTKLLLVGIAIGSGIASGGTVMAFAKLIFG